MSTSSELFSKMQVDASLDVGLLVCCGGFETRALTIAKRMHGCDARANGAVVLHYESQRADNEGNYEKLVTMMKSVSPGQVDTVDVNASFPLVSYERIRARIMHASRAWGNRRVTVDISGMTHLWALGVIHACVLEGLEVDVAYTEARGYFPKHRDAEPLRRAWQERDYTEASQSLQSAALMAIHILPDFAGNFRPGHPTCLIVFAGYEPNRLEGLIDSYAPGALVVLYGKSPRPAHQWRTKLSKALHAKMFSEWPLREDECSTLSPEEALGKLEEIAAVVGSKYDVAVAPHCSKMQGVASYVFWRRHPETQLIFTSPVRFSPQQYSICEREVYVYRLSAALRP